MYIQMGLDTSACECVWEGVWSINPLASSPQVRAHLSSTSHAPLYMPAKPMVPPSTNTPAPSHFHSATGGFIHQPMPQNLALYELLGSSNQPSSLTPSRPPASKQGESAFVILVLPWGSGRPQEPLHQHPSPLGHKGDSRFPPRISPDSPPGTASQTLSLPPYQPSSTSQQQAFLARGPRPGSNQSSKTKA